MFAGFLRRRLERDDPARLKDLHRTASDWFADHGDLSYAVDHALAAGETTRAVDLVEQDRTIGAGDQARMATLLGVIEKLPPQLASSRPRVHLSVAVANIVLQRPAATEAALDRVTDAIHGRPEGGDAGRSEPGGQRIARGGPNGRRRVEGLAHLVAQVYRGRRRCAQCCPRRQRRSRRSRGGSTVSTSRQPIGRWNGRRPTTRGPRPGTTAAGRALPPDTELDIPRALRSFRKAFDIGTAVGRESQAARHAGALLGELLYEIGEFAEAADLLEESYRLGPEAGAVDYLVAQYAVSARIKAAQGYRDAAASRLDAGMTVAEKLALPRLAAAINYERVRLQLPISAPEAARLRAIYRVFHAGNGIATITGELDEASGIRLLSRSHASDDRDQACRRAGTLLAGINPTLRPLAALQARLLLAETLTVAGLANDARNHIAETRALCAQHGLPQLLIDARLG